MTILSSEIKLYRATTINDTASNGGRLSTVVCPSGLSNADWPNITEAQKAAGATQYRKFFVKIDNAANESMTNARIGLLAPTSGDDRLYLLAGTQTDIQSGVGSTLYGCGKLDSSVSAGASSIAVAVEKGTDIVFRNGDSICITDKATVNGAGNREFHTVSGTPSVAGDIVTIGLAGTLANNYSNSDTHVTSLVALGTIAGSVGTATVTSAAGTFDNTKMTVSNIGGLYQIWTFTFSSSTAFSCSGDTVGSVGTGNVNSTFAPTNSALGSSYFSLLASAWGGTYANGDTVQITSTPAARGYWEKRVVPAGATTLNAHTRWLTIYGEG